MKNPECSLSAKTVLILAGGTGGHVFPALAVARELRKRGWRVEWLGTNAGIETSVVPANDIPLHRISAVGLRGKGIGKLLLAPWYLMGAFYQTTKIFRQIKPDVVLGMGGFVAGTGGICARLFGVPLIIHEQNAVAGTTNRILSCMARRVLFAFPDTFASGELVGNPVREDIARLADKPKKLTPQSAPLKLLVLGGSQGAHALNSIMPQALALLPDDMRPDVFHQAGKKRQEATRELYLQARVQARVEEFIEDMAAMYEWADIAVCRAGAMTISELACAQLPAVLIPFPYAIDDHQTANACWMVRAGVGILQPESQLSGRALAEILTKFMVDRDALQSMMDRLRALANPLAAERLANICEEESCVN